jgi:YidC/Oxa1 family membrane protein insertase
MDTEKRFFLAMSLSLLVLMFYTSTRPKPQPAPIQSAQTPAQEARPIKTVGAMTEVLQKDVQPPPIDHIINEELYSVETSGMVLAFSRQGGFLRKVIDKKRDSAIIIQDIGLVSAWSQYAFKAFLTPDGVDFEHVTQEGLKIKKRFIFKDEYSMILEIDLDNIKDYKSTSYSIFVGSLDPLDVKDRFSQRYFESSVFLKDSVARKSAFNVRGAVSFDGPIAWAGLRSRYYCSIISPELIINKAVMDSWDRGSFLTLKIPVRPLPSDLKSLQDIYHIYVGPQDGKSLKAFAEGTEQIINFGFFDGISRIIMFLLTFAFKVVHNWGAAIILVTIFIYVLMSPLSMKSMISMKKMQALQPMIEELKSRHKDSPQKLNTEIMELYRREKVNPLGGCLPMMLQIPVFFSLYQLLMRFIHLKGARFLWIKDLSEPDRLANLPFSLPVLGQELNLLPILMGVGMFLQQRFSAMSGSGGGTSEQQKMLSYVMPVLFTGLFYKLSSGLVLYWFVNSMLMFGFQWKISKRKI